MSSSRRGEHGPDTALGTHGCLHWWDGHLDWTLECVGPRTGCSYSRSAVVLGDNHLDQLNTPVKGAGKKHKAYFF